MWVLESAIFWRFSRFTRFLFEFYWVFKGFLPGLFYVESSTFLRRFLIGLVIYGHVCLCFFRVVSEFFRSAFLFVILLFKLHVLKNTTCLQFVGTFKINPGFTVKNIYR